MISLICERIAEFGLLFVIVLLAYCTGRKVLGYFNGYKPYSLRDFIFGSAAGLGIFSYLVLLLGMCGLLYRWIIYLVLAVIAVFCLGEIKKIIVTLKEKLKAASAGHLTALEAGLAIVMVVTGILVLFGTLAPPSLYDSLVYHLAAPDVYISNHGINRIPFNFFANFPAVGEMLFTLGMLVYNDILAKLINFMFLALTALAVYSFTKHYFNNKTAILSSVFYCTIPTVMLLATGAYIDLILAFFCFLVFYSFMLWVEEGRDGWLVLSGLFSGLAVGTKYTGIVIFIILVSGVAIKAILIDRKSRGIFRRVLMLSIPFIAVFSPWLIKNYIFTGNPVFPFLFKTCDGFWGPGNALKYFTHINGHGMPVKNLWDFLILPWALTTQGIRFGGSFDIWGPIIFISMPLLVFVRRIKKEIRYVLSCIFLYYVIWLFTARVARFLVPALPLVSIIAGYVFIEALNGKRIRRVVGVVLGAVFVVALAHNLYMYIFCEIVIDPFKVSVGAETREEYLLRKIPYYPAVKYINEQLPEDSRVLFIGEARGYYCKMDYIAGSVFNKTPIVEWAEESGSAEELREILIENRISHVLLNDREAVRLQGGYGIFYWTEKGRRLFYEFAEKYMIVIYEHRDVSVYRVIEG